MYKNRLLVYNKSIPKMSEYLSSPFLYPVCDGMLQMGCFYLEPYFIRE